MTLIDIIVHCDNASMIPMTTYDISLGVQWTTHVIVEEAPSRHWGGPNRITLSWSPGGLYNTTVFADYMDGRSYPVTNFTSIHNGQWQRVRFLRDGGEWIIDYRTQVEVPSADETDSPGTPPDAR